jgi:cysteine synthase
VPDDVSLEKVKALEVLGAHVEMVRPASIVDKKQASILALLTGCRGLSYFSTSVRGECTTVDYLGKDC